MNKLTPMQTHILHEALRDNLPFRTLKWGRVWIEDGSHYRQVSKRTIASLVARGLLAQRTSDIGVIWIPTHKAHKQFEGTKENERYAQS